MQPPIEPMLAAAVDELPPSCPGGCAHEPKWDGWRALVFVLPDRVHIQSRSGKSLSAYFPDVAQAVRDFLPVGAVVDGELVIWDAARERTSFVLLHRRMTAGRALPREAVTYPAHLVCFDVLQEAGVSRMGEPLRVRRAHLARLLVDTPSSLTLCPQTTDQATAMHWLREWSAAGVEGLVVKGLKTPYRPGRRGWWKLRDRRTTEAIVGGVTGTLSHPQTLLLGRLDETERLRFIGRTVPLPLVGRRQIASLILPTAHGRDRTVDHPWPDPLPASWMGQFGSVTPLAYQPTAPTVVVEVEVDPAYEYGRLRHPARFVRARPDLSIFDVPPQSNMDS